MIDDDDHRSDEIPFARSYDFFKHMTGIALISLGGVFAFLDKADTQLERRQVFLVLAFIGLSGITSLMMATSLAGLEVKPEDHAKMARRVKFGQVAVSFLIAVGLGAFVPAFTDAVLK